VVDLLVDFLFYGFWLLWVCEVYGFGGVGGGI